MASEDRLEQLDYYELLQIESSASADDVRKAFHAFALRYHPDNHVEAPPEKRERAAQIYRRGAEAYRVLCDRELRRLYDAQRARGKLRFDPEEAAGTASGSPGAAGEHAPAQSLRVKSPRARPFVQKALDACKKGDWATAKLNLKLALQHEPGNTLLEAHLAEVEQKLAKR